MAQVHHQPITVGNLAIGSVSVDGGTVTGVGGAMHPRLVVPLAITLNPTSAESMVAVVWVRAWLAADSDVSPHTLVCAPTTESLFDQFPAQSLVGRPNEHIIHLQFSLTSAEVEALERHRHGTQTDVFNLHLGLDAVTAGLRPHNQLQPDQPVEQTPWTSRYGMFVEVLPFWHTQVQPVLVAIERSTWVREVLPGLGYNRQRLIELSFPPPLPDHPSAATEWDRARRAVDEQRYADAVAECRDLLSMWERQLGASKSQPMAIVIAERRGWAAGDVRQTFLAGLWKAAIDVVNASHHPEGAESTQNFDAADARLVLLLTAALSEYVVGQPPRS